VLTASPAVAVTCYVVSREASKPLALEVELRDGARVLAQEKSTLKPQTSTEPQEQVATLQGLGQVRRWKLDEPFLYTVVVRLKDGH